MPFLADVVLLQMCCGSGLIAEFRDGLRDCLWFVPLVVLLGRVEGLFGVRAHSFPLNCRQGRPIFLAYVSRIYKVVIYVAQTLPLMLCFIALILLY